MFREKYMLATSVNTRAWYVQYKYYIRFCEVGSVYRSMPGLRYQPFCYLQKDLRLLNVLWALMPAYAELGKLSLCLTN
jgi:hypothetical protein